MPPCGGGEHVGNRIGLAVVCLHISAAMYLLLGALVSFFFISDDKAAIGVILGVFCLGLIVGIEVVVYGLRKRMNWAWIAGLCIFAVYVPSLFFPLGALGLWALLDNGTQRAFIVGSKTRPGPISDKDLFER
jgi:hypothetical protein